MTMYLVTKEKALIGVCVERTDGWWFQPNTASRRPSRKPRKSAADCIPLWAFDMSDDLLTLAEWKAR